MSPPVSFLLVTDSHSQYYYQCLLTVTKWHHQLAHVFKPMLYSRSIVNEDHYHQSHSNQPHRNQPHSNHHHYPQCAGNTVMASGTHDIVIAGGMESMSNVPYYLPKARSGYRLGHGTLLDGMIHDGLWDPYVDQHMGQCAESCAQKYGISRDQQDDHALETFRRANEAAMSGATGMVECRTVTVKHDVYVMHNNVHTGMLQ